MLRDFLNRLESNIVSCPEGVDAERYSEIFEFTNAEICIPLWESAYRSDMRILLDENTLKVVRYYLEEGLFPADVHEPGDYIITEIHFLRFLLREGKYDKAEAFLKEHVLFLSESIAKEIQRIETDQYYRDFAEYVIDTVKNLRGTLNERYISEVYRKEYREAYQEETSTEYMTSFRHVTEEEKQELLRERIIESSGSGNCGGRCRIRVHVTSGCITELSANAGDPEKALRPCLRGRNYRGTYMSAERIRYPMVRAGERGSGKFRRISWQEALDIILRENERIKTTYGPGSRFVSYGSGINALMRGNVLMKRLFAMDGGFLDYFNTYSNAQVMTALPYTFGTTMVNSSYSTYEASELLILWSFNPVITFHNPEIYEMLKYHKKKGTMVVAIDPFCNETAAAFAGEWIGIRPGTDSALVNAVAYVIWEEGLQDKAFMDKYCSGFDREHMPAGFENEESFHDYIFGIRDGLPKTPEWAEKITGIAAEKIRWFAKLYATKKPAAILTGWGIQRQTNGEQATRSLSVLPCMTGNIGIPGGSTAAMGRLPGHLKPVLPVPENPYHGSIPVFLWTDSVTRGHEMTAGKDFIKGRTKLQTDVKMIVNIAGNTLVNQHSDHNSTIKILKDTEKCEFIVASDMFFTSSVRYADLVLPGSGIFEHDNITMPYGSGNFLLYQNEAVSPLFESKFDYEWIKELAEKMGFSDFTEGTGDLPEWLRLMYERVRVTEPELPDFSLFRKNGGYSYKNNKTVIAFSGEIQDPEKHPFPTDDGKINIFSPKLLSFGDPENIPAIPKFVAVSEGVMDPDKEKYPIQMLGRHSKRRTHSTHERNRWLESVEPHRIWINTEDAEERGINDGDEVMVYNERGRIRIRALVTDRIISGVCSIPQGAWYTPDEEGTDVRGSVNTLTSLTPSPLAKGNGQHTVLVEIRRYESGKDLKFLNGNKE